VPVVQRKKCRLWRTVRDLLKTGQFAALHSHGLTAAGHGALARLGLGVPHVVTLHEPIGEHRFRGWLGPLRRWGLGVMLRQADAVVVVSDASRDNLLTSLPSFRKAAGRIVTVPNGIDTTRYDGAENEHGGDLRDRLGVAPGTRLLGYLGRF